MKKVSHNANIYGFRTNISCPVFIEIAGNLEQFLPQSMLKKMLTKSHPSLPPSIRENYKNYESDSE